VRRGGGGGGVTNRIELMFYIIRTGQSGRPIMRHIPKIKIKLV